MLMQVDIDAHIPHELYIAVAELLAWLYRLEHATGYVDLPPPPVFDPLKQTE
jgi:flagellar biosynthesis protein